MREILATCFIRVAIMIIQQVWIVHTYQERDVKVGEMVNLECPFNTSLAKWVYWKKDNHTIYSLKVETEMEDGTARFEGTSQAKYLTIKDLRETDSGVYGCKVLIGTYILDSADEGSLVRLSVKDQDKVIPSTTFSVPYNTEKIPFPPAKNEDGLQLLYLLILIPIAVIILVIIFIIYCKRSRIQELVNGGCNATRKRRGYKMSSSGSHDDPKGTEDVPLAEIGKSLKSDHAGSNAQQTLAREEEQQLGSDSEDFQLPQSKFTPCDTSSPLPNKGVIRCSKRNRNYKWKPFSTSCFKLHRGHLSSVTEYQLPLVGKVLMIAIHSTSNKDDVLQRLLNVVHCHVHIAGERKPPKSGKYLRYLEKYAKERYPDQEIEYHTLQLVAYVLHELDKIPSGRWRDRCEVLLTMPENQQRDKSTFYSQTIYDCTQVVSENDSNGDNPEIPGLLKRRMELWMANPRKRKCIRYFISREILYADVATKEVLKESFIDFQKSASNLLDEDLHSNEYHYDHDGKDIEDLVEFWISKIWNLDSKSQQRILVSLYQERGSSDGQHEMPTVGAQQPKNMEKIMDEALSQKIPNVKARQKDPNWSWGGTEPNVIKNKKTNEEIHRVHTM